MDNKITAIILAGGLGTRLRSAVPNLPKPMANIRKRPFLEYLMDYWIKQGVDKFILSVGYMHKTIIKHFGDNYNGVQIEYVIENRPLGTGGALLKCSKGLKESFLVINGDTFIEVKLKELINFHLSHKSELTLSLFIADKSNRYKRIMVTEDGVIRFLQSDLSQTGQLANGGVYFINPSALRRINCKANSKISLEDELLDSFIYNKGRLHGIKFSGKFIDIGVPEDYYNAEKILCSR